jgi:segregation and condensation protein B
MPDVRKEVESLLFASGKTMTEKDLSDIIGARPSDVKKAIEELKKDYDTRDTSITLMDTGEGWKMNVKEKYVTLVTKIVADTELPFPVLETLSIIAYRAPAWQAEVIDARGTNAYEHIQSLIEGGFIERRKKGRSFELGLTQKFFEYFDVEGEKSLKMILKDVKASEPKKKKLGDLPVVDLPEGQQVWNPAPAGQVQSPTVSPEARQ